MKGTFLNLTSLYFSAPLVFVRFQKQVNKVYRSGKAENESGDITKDCEASSYPGAAVFTGPADNLPDACSFCFPSLL